MQSAPAFHLTNIPPNEHIMLLYDGDDERDDAVVDNINKGLKSGYQCIYASVNAYDSKVALLFQTCPIKLIIIKKILKVVNYKLLILNLIESALDINLRPFKKLKMKLEETLEHRKSEGKKDAILVCADAACFLSHNNQFEESEILEW
ncbi:MAG TPA: hypothetical protein VFM31_09800 [Nitrososphaeraceae archaeon]|nr:hypothetical protein [Nitrososphaeraceae archaeon]